MPAALKIRAALSPAGPPPMMQIAPERSTRGEPGYSSKLDRDGDGVACE
ncbi:excalibur calcium-binding domain-containing protein [Tomitella biformata]|nr:excalibur calcium-binding domain-containing protein [Tomitella biformata]